MFSGRHCESPYNGSDMRGGSAQRGEDSDLPAGLAAAGSQKARFSDSASFAAVLKTAAGKIAEMSVPRHRRSSFSDCGRCTCRGTASSAQHQHVLPNRTQSLHGLWPPADLFHLNFYFIRKVLPHLSTPTALPTWLGLLS